MQAVGSIIWSGILAKVFWDSLAVLFGLVVSLIRPLHPLRLSTFGHDMAGLVRGGRGGFSVKRGFILPRIAMAK